MRTDHGTGGQDLDAWGIAAPTGHGRPGETDSTAFRREALASFLRQRRESLSPTDVGLPHSPRRRTPGLRREEVAVLANVGVTWYTRIEQGRELSVSPLVVSGIADALRLTEGERDYLFELTGAPRPVRDRQTAEDDLGLVGELLDSITERPAYCVDRYWTVVAANPLAEYVFGVRPGSNCLEEFFTKEEVMRKYPFRELTAHMLTAQFREQAAKFAGDARFGRIVDGLAARSPAFAELWSSHVVGVAPHLDLVYDHPQAGRLSFSSTVLTPFGGHDRRIFVYIPKPGTSTAESLRRIR